MPPVPQQLGNIGARIDLAFRQGTTLGPIRVQLRQPGARPVDLTGGVVMGGVRRRAVDQEVLADFDIEVDDAEQGMFHFGLSADKSAALGRNNRGYDQIKLFWEMRFQDATGAVSSLFWGEVSLFLGALDG